MVAIHIGVKYVSLYLTAALDIGEALTVPGSHDSCAEVPLGVSAPFIGVDDAAIKDWLSEDKHSSSCKQSKGT
jgi:hypothetical protein